MQITNQRSAKRQVKGREFIRFWSMQRTNFEWCFIAKDSFWLCASISIIKDKFYNILRAYIALSQTRRCLNGLKRNLQHRLSVLELLKLTVFSTLIPHFHYKFNKFFGSFFVIISIIILIVIAIIRKQKSSSTEDQNILWYISMWKRHHRLSLADARLGWCFVFWALL